MFDLHKMERKISLGGKVAFMAAALTIMQSIALFFILSLEFNHILEGLLHATVLIVCGFGVLRRSVTAAIALLFITVNSTLFLFIAVLEEKRLPAYAIVVNLIFSYFYFDAAIGVYRYHRYMEGKDTKYPVKYKRSFMLTVVIGMLVTLFYLIGILSQFGYLNIGYKESDASEAFDSLKGYVNESQSWDESSIRGYEIFFTKLTLANWKDKEVLKDVDEWFLREMSESIARCVTLHALKEYNDPSLLLSKQLNEDQEVLIKLKYFFDNCFDESIDF